MTCYHTPYPSNLTISCYHCCIAKEFKEQMAVIWYRERFFYGLYHTDVLIHVIPHTEIHLLDTSAVISSKFTPSIHMISYSLNNLLCSPIYDSDRDMLCLGIMLYFAIHDRDCMLLRIRTSILGDYLYAPKQNIHWIIIGGTDWIV